MPRLIKLLSVPYCLLLIVVVTSSGQNVNPSPLLNEVFHQPEMQRQMDDTLSTYELEMRRGWNKEHIDNFFALWDLLEKSLEKYGATKRVCQMRATCEIYKKRADGIELKNFEKDVIELVNEWLKELEDPRIPLGPAMLIEELDDAAYRGRKGLDCKKLYKKCPEIY